MNDSAIDIHVPQTKKNTNITQTKLVDKTRQGTWERKHEIETWCFGIMGISWSAAVPGTRVNATLSLLQCCQKPMQKWYVLSVFKIWTFFISSVTCWYRMLVTIIMAALCTIYKVMTRNRSSETNLCTTGCMWNKWGMMQLAEQVCVHALFDSLGIPDWCCQLWLALDSGSVWSLSSKAWKIVTLFNCLLLSKTLVILVVTWNCWPIGVLSR